MPSRGRHQSSSKECLRAISKIEALPGVVGVIIGRSYGGKSLGKSGRTGEIRVQREVPGGLKAVTQSSKGLQELFIRTDQGAAEKVWQAIESDTS
jgi:2-keto-3-deoxy-L-rhamnonate aldolase RhmA